MTPQERKVMELALEALEVAEHFVEEYAASKYYFAHVAAIAATKEALMSQSDGAQPEHEFVEDLQAKLKWATEQLEANINWEFVAFAKEEMLKAAWAEIKELREQIKEPEQRSNEHLEPVAYPCIVVDVDYSMDTAAILIQDTRDYEFNDGQYWLSTTPPQRTWVGLTDEEILSWWSMDNDLEDLDMCNIVHFRKVIEEVQAKLKEKNT